MRYCDTQLQKIDLIDYEYKAIYEERNFYTGFICLFISLVVLIIVPSK